MSLTSPTFGRYYAVGYTDKDIDSHTQEKQMVDVEPDEDYCLEMSCTEKPKQIVKAAMFELSPALDNLLEADKDGYWY